MFDRIARVVLAGGSLFFGAWGLARPQTLARTMGASEDAAREIGFRDTGAGLLILAVPGPAPYLVRALFDVGDAVTIRREKPRVAVGALAFAALALVAALRAR